MISSEQKKKLKNFLGDEIADTEANKDIRNVKEAVSSMNEGLSASMQEGLRALERKISKIQNTDLTPVIDVLNKLADVIIKSGKENKSVDMSGFFKDFAVQIAETGKTSKDTAELIKNLKWNSTMGIKNRNGNPISPNVSPFQLEDWNDVLLEDYDGNGNPATVTYKLGPQTVAIIELSYDGSGNLTEAIRTA